MCLAAMAAEAVLIKDLPLKDWKFWCLPAAIMVYALWGTPTPDALGWPEIVIGLLLVLAAGLPQAAKALGPGDGEPWQRAGKALLVYGMSVPLLAGLAAGNDFTAIIRDLIPFLFLLLPLFLYPRWQNRAGHIRLLTGAAALLGVLFALRVLLPAAVNPAGLQPLALSDPFLLANAPTVLFAGLLLSGGGFYALYRQRLMTGAALCLLSAIPLFTMALIAQRASIGFFSLSVLFLLALGLWRRPLRVMLPLALCLLTLFTVWPLVAGIGQELARKTAAVGLNMRWHEAQAVMESLGGSSISVLFGKGWGASIISPAVGGAEVNFTHSLLTTYWLKTGLVGLGFALAYLYRLGLMLLEILYYSPVIALALAGPFMIDILLYASFKSLDFGLVLLLIPLWSGLACRRE